MQNPNYGVLKGPVVKHEAQPGGNPHYSLFIEANGKRFRAAINVESRVAPHEIEYVITEGFESDVLAMLTRMPATFRLASQGAPRLDFVADKLVTRDNRQHLPEGTLATANPFYSKLVEVAEQAQQQADRGAFVCVFGTGFPGRAPGSRSGGFATYQGIDNIHMNQGNSKLNLRFWKENGSHQDGGLLFCFPDGNGGAKWIAFFVMFHSQTLDVDQDGFPHEDAVFDALASVALAGLADAAPRARRQAVATALDSHAKLAVGSGAYPCTIHMLDVGEENYGDCILCRFGSTTVLIDGGHSRNIASDADHPSIPDQLGALLGQTEMPYKISLLVVTHAHDDHIGCLPDLIGKNILTPEWALVADPDLGFPKGAIGGATGGGDASANVPAGRRAEPGTDDATNDIVRRLVAAMGEESRDDGISDAVLSDFLDSVGSLEDDYRGMVKTLQQQIGNQLVRFGRDNPNPLLERFHDIGLHILGPSLNQLVVCADQIKKSEGAAARRVNNALAIASNAANDAANQDVVALPSSGPDLVTLYRKLIQPPDASDSAADAMDAATAGGSGPARNDQSQILRFAFGGRKFLFTGDMQFAQSGVTQATPMINALRESVRGDGPYDFVKVPHHGAVNAFDERFYGAVSANDNKKRYFGVSSGARDPGHPSRMAREVLNSHAAAIQWTRTDHNGLCTFGFGVRPNDVKMLVTTGAINDSTPNTPRLAANEDETVPTMVSGQTVSGMAPTTSSQEQSPSAGHTVAEPAVVSSASPVALPLSLTPTQPLPVVESRANTGAGSRTASESRSEIVSGMDGVEVRARLPFAGAKVTLTVEVEPRTEPKARDGTVGLPDNGNGSTSHNTRINPPTCLTIGGGRALPPLLFVTNRDALAANIGADNTTLLLRSLQAAGQTVNDALPGNASDAIKLVNAQLRQLSQIKGVVILGGYDVVAPERLSVLDPVLQNDPHFGREIEETDPFDRYCVWSDSDYGTRQNVRLPELPVSRIPDGSPQGGRYQGAADLLFRAIQCGQTLARAPQVGRKAGIRNIQRPFAEQVFAPLPGASNLLISEHTVYNQTPPYDLSGEWIYLMLHGSDQDGTRFWGETTNHDYLVAVQDSNVPRCDGSVVFSGCCWGALLADPIARLADPTTPLKPRNPSNSLAMRFLQQGAWAFVGCTGAHYSPIDPPPYDYYGKPLHDAFWKHSRQGKTPAEALFAAKIEYLDGIPHRDDPVTHARELKILRQYTCLGLGW